MSGEIKKCPDCSSKKEHWICKDCKLVGTIK
jgi:hypothetical protein